VVDVVILLLLLVAVAGLAFLLAQWCRWDARLTREETGQRWAALDDDEAWAAAVERDDFDMWTVECRDLRRWARKLRAS
jgi:hypothetical protein